MLDGILFFFKDTLVGVYYYIYAFFNILFTFAIIGYIGEKKEKELNMQEAGEINTQLNSNN